MRLRYFVFFIIIVICFPSFLKGQNYLEMEERWIQSNLENMTIDEKIGQMMIIRAYSKGDEAEKNYILSLIEKYKIGGVCFFQGDPERQVMLTNMFKGSLKIPLFIAIDGEWGLGMRHSEKTISFPKNLILGAIQDESLIYKLGKEIGSQCKTLGINFNFSPVADININSKNPVIYDRSFGESKENVTSKSYLMFKGLEDAGVLSCAKHFPGHGDTDKDSHYTLPVLEHDKYRLDDVELFPFRRLAAQNIGSIMVGHLYLSKVETDVNRPASLSRTIITGMLREELSYRGLILTDGLDMKAITKNFPSGIAEAEAVWAGNDILLLPENIPLAIQTIKKYIKEGKISFDQIDASIRRILAAKYKLGLHLRPYYDENNIFERINSQKALALKAELMENAVTLLKDEKKNIPIRQTKDINTATLSINTDEITIFQRRIDDYTKARHYHLQPGQLNEKKTSLINTFKQFDRVIISIHSEIGTRFAFKELPTDVINFLKEIEKMTEVIIVFFGNPYFTDRLENFPAVLLAYDDEEIMQDITAQCLFGANPIKGKMPVNASSTFSLGLVNERASLGRLGFGVPERAGVDSRKLLGIDSILSVMVQTGATPGGQLVVAKNGKIIINKPFGRLTPLGEKVEKNTVYDVASLTKILSTSLAAMKLYEEKKLSLTRPLKFYISDLIHTNKEEMELGEVLAHEAGLRAYIPFHKETLVKVQKTYLPDTNFYRQHFSPDFAIPVSEKLFLRTDYRDSIWYKIYHSELRSGKSYRYSDLGFFLVQKTIEEITRQKLDEYVDQNFYRPLDLHYTAYKPLEKIPISLIAPSEVDNYFRNSVIRGTVHDMSAAMLGGVAGNAGLFSTATEATMIMQMLLNGGHYGGIRFFQPETVQFFTSRYNGSTRRGLGFDLKELNPKKTENMSELAPASTYGHLGFTGTVTFADPENQIVFTLLANRTYPTMDNNSMHVKKYRIKLQDEIYKALLP